MAEVNRDTLVTSRGPVVNGDTFAQGIFAVANRDTLVTSGGPVVNGDTSAQRIYGCGKSGHFGHKYL